MGLNEYISYVGNGRYRYQASKYVFKANDQGRYLATIDSIDYEFIVLRYEEVGDFATIVINDLTHNETYYSNGCIMANGHEFRSYWELEYSPYRDNYIHNHNLIVEVD